MPEAIGWTGVVMALLAMIRGEVAAWTARKAAKDKLEFDAELLMLKTQNGTQAKQIADCEKKHQACEEKHEEHEQRLNALAALIAHKKDDTGEHTPTK